MKILALKIINDIVILVLYAATLTIYQGRVTIDGATSLPVEGVAVLNLGGTAMLSHLFDCATNGSTSDLMWEKDEGDQRFPTSLTSITFQENRINVRRMNMGPMTNMMPVDYDDVGVYTCVNSRTGERMSVNITGGE